MEPDEDYETDDFWKEQERLAEEEEKLMNEIIKEKQ